MHMMVMILAITILTVIAIGLLPRLMRGTSRPLRTGDRIRLSGGYDSKPTWLDSRASVDGEVLAFIADATPMKSALVRLTSPISVDGFTSEIVALHLRYLHSRWGQREIVHVELLDGIPRSENDGGAAHAKWIESHAMYAVLS